MKVKLLHPKALSPTRGTRWSAGWDLYAIEDTYIFPNESLTIPLGISVDIGRGNVGLLCNRSSQWFKHGVFGEGKIDADFRSEVKIHLKNTSNTAYMILAGDRIAQLLIVPVDMREVRVVEELEVTSRTGGVGSTGK